VIQNIFPTRKGHVSFSEVKNWSECPWRHKLLYIEKKGTFEGNVHTFFGTAVHESCESFIKTKKMKPEIAVNMIRKEWKENGFDDVESWCESAERILSEVPSFLDETFPGWEPYDAEEQLFESIDNHDLKFKGFIDAILKVPGKNGKFLYWILDWKTTSWGWSPFKKRDFIVSSQPRLYKVFWSKKHNIPESQVRTGFVLLKRSAKDGKRCELVTVSVGPKSRTKSLKIVDNMIKSVKKGVFLKNRLSCKYCEFKDTSDCT